MSTIGDVVNEAKSLVAGTQNSEIALLADAYSPGDSTLRLAQSVRVTSGAIASSGLTTFRVLGPASDEVSVVAGTDGSPDEALPAGSVIDFQPRFTNWQVFQNVRNTIEEMCSPANGLYAWDTGEFQSDTVDETYPLSQTVLKVLRVRYRELGSLDRWHEMSFKYQPNTDDGPIVVAYGAPGGTTVEVVAAVRYTAPSSLTETLESLSIPDRLHRALVVGAARDLALSGEFRRVQPFSQGDPRRADEVPITGNIIIYDRLTREFRGLVNQERAFLNTQHPYRVQMEKFFRSWSM